MSEGIVWLVESLESRCLLSAAHHVSGKTMAAPLAPPDITQPASPSVKRRHHVAAATPFAVSGGLAGVWTGGQNSLDNSWQGSVSLSVFAGSAGYYAVLKFDRPGGGSVSMQSQFVLQPDGQFSFQVLTPKMMVRFTGTIFNHGTRTSSVPTMNGTFQYWDKQGTYKGAFAMTAQHDLPLG